MERLAESRRTPAALPSGANGEEGGDATGFLGGETAGKGRHELWRGGEGRVAIWPHAGQAEMVRSQQKDELYTSVLHGMVTDSAQTLIGPRAVRRWEAGLKAASDAAYHGLTTLRGMQTLGEDYCDIQQVEAGSEMLPSASTRSALVLWKSLCPYLFGLVQARLISAICAPSGGPSVGRLQLPPATRTILQEFLPQIRGAGAAIQRFHLAIFYLFGRYLSIPHRLAEVEHLSLGGRRSGGATPFSPLGWLILGEQAISLGMMAAKVLRLMKSMRGQELGGGDVQGEGRGEESGSIVEQGGKCMLCLGDRKITTATACGHLFCWTCIMEWCSSKAECPLCRQPISQQSLLRITNYHPPPE